MASAPGCHLQVASAPAVAFNRLQHRLSPTTGFTIGCLLQWRQHRLSPSCGFRPQLSPANRLQHGCRLQHASASAATYNTGSNPRLSPSNGFNIGCRLYMATASAVDSRWLQPPAVAFKSASTSAAAFNRLQHRLSPSNRLQHWLSPTTGFSPRLSPSNDINIG